MDSFGIIDVDKIDVSKIQIGVLRGLPSGPNGSETSSMKTARILYDGQPLKVRLNKMATSWGLSAPLNSDKGMNQSYRMELSLGRDPEESSIYKLCKYLDDACKKNAEENPKDYLFKRQFSQDLVSSSTEAMGYG